jgi:hypothetical protein
MDRILEKACQFGKSILDQMDPSHTNQAYLFHCREALGRVAKINDRYTGRIDELLQKQLTRVSHDHIIGYIMLIYHIIT